MPMSERSSKHLPWVAAILSKFFDSVWEWIVSAGARVEFEAAVQCDFNMPGSSVAFGRESAGLPWTDAGAARLRAVAV